MSNRNKEILHILLQKEDTPEKKKKISLSKFLLRLVLKIGKILTIKFFLLLIFFLLPLIIIIIIIMLSMSIWDPETWTTPSNSAENNYFQYFSKQDTNIPLWIPVEEWRITYWFDYNQWKDPISDWFIKITYPWEEEYYPKHSWLDFWLSRWNMNNKTLPGIYNTHKWIIKKIDTRTSKWDTYYYTSLINNSNSFIEKKFTIKKHKEWDDVPYWNSVLLSSLDGKFYTIYAHLDSINWSLKNNIIINRGHYLWKMGNTWRSTWTHLHYEIRYCWENNNSYKKSWWNCKPINPLGFIKKDSVTFLGIKSLPQINLFKVWDVKVIKESIVSESKTHKQIIDNFNNFCKNNELLFKWKSFECIQYFPIHYVLENNKINKKDSLEEFDKIYKEDRDIENAYNSFFYSWIYDDLKNPYVYNFLDKQHLYLQILNESWDKISLNDQYWSLAIYNIIK